LKQPVEKITYYSSLLAIIIRSNFSKDGIEFFTPNDFSQQLDASPVAGLREGSLRLAYMNCPEIIRRNYNKPHVMDYINDYML